MKLPVSSYPALHVKVQISLYEGTPSPPSEQTTIPSPGLGSTGQGTNTKAH